MIGDDVEISVVDITDGKVRLGVTGPAGIPVHQRERYDAQQRQHRDTISSSHLTSPLVRSFNDAPVS
jgi:carbon storage regulator